MWPLEARSEAPQALLAKRCLCRLASSGCRPRCCREGDEPHVASPGARQSEYGALAQCIWERAEVGERGEQSAVAWQKTFGEAGFMLEVRLAGMPTAFVATAGAGKPVIGLLAEFDVLPGLS